ncbi:MAG: carotenoid biosynthesis protein [Patescibacteria group bacterium]|nr:carotenoid biosynthesis protein [Patescibacteria group bacterium]
MNTQKKSRLVKVTFAITLALILWGLVGVFLESFSVTMYWGIGLGVVAGLAFVTSLAIQKFGIKNGLLIVLPVLVTVFGALSLNQMRGWPFGMVTFHDILGWKIFLGISWPVPVFWTCIIVSMLLLTQPKESSKDPKILFSWAFDTAILTMLVSLIIEPILNNTSALAWSVQGPFLGVPFSSFLGWFLTAFVAAFIAILAGKPYLVNTQEKSLTLFISLLGFGILSSAAAHRFNLPAIEIMGVIFSLAFIFLLIRKICHFDRSSEGDEVEKS